MKPKRQGASSKAVTWKLLPLMMPELTTRLPSNVSSVGHCISNTYGRAAEVVGVAALDVASAAAAAGATISAAVGVTVAAAVAAAVKVVR